MKILWWQILWQSDFVEMVNIAESIRDREYWKGHYDGQIEGFEEGYEAGREAEAQEAEPQEDLDGNGAPEHSVP